jgi:hypothetical protein
MTRPFSLQLQCNNVDAFMLSPVGMIAQKQAMRSHCCLGSTGGASTTRMCLDPKQPARGRSQSPVGRSRPDPTSPSPVRSDSRSSSVDAKKTILAEFTDMWLPDDLALDMEMEGIVRTDHPDIVVPFVTSSLSECVHNPRDVLIL